jgi:hypothetical protein
MSKLRSHLRLCSELVGSKQFLETFTKDHLQRLCAAMPGFKWSPIFVWNCPNQQKNETLYYLW